MFNQSESVDEMFMEFWIYMSFCMLNLIKGGDLLKNDFWFAKSKMAANWSAILDFVTLKMSIVIVTTQNMIKYAKTYQISYQISQTRTPYLILIISGFVPGLVAGQAMTKTRSDCTRSATYLLEAE